MNFKLVTPLAGVLAIALAASAMAAPSSSDVPDNLLTAIADPARPEKDRARDAARHPGEILAFAGVKPGDKVGDFIIGGGYFTRILAKAVGPTGKVYAFTPAEFISFNKQYGTDLDTVAGAYSNVVPLKTSLGAYAPAEKLDLIFTAQNYHDMHLGFMKPEQIAAVNKSVFDALKPGGVYLVIDHYAKDGSGTADSSKLHRIDIASVKSELTAAGFVLEGESPLLRAEADPRTASVFDDSIKGKTDQFVLKFRKPK